MSADNKIADVLSKYGEDFAANTWVVPGGKARAVHHACIERMVARAGIEFDPPVWISADPNNVVIVVTGRSGEQLEWSVGECSPKNNKNAYPYSMAEKRGKDRVALKLLRLHGLLYSEQEADEFKDVRPEDDAAPEQATPPKPRLEGKELADMLIKRVTDTRTLDDLVAMTDGDAFNVRFDRLDSAEQLRVKRAIDSRRAHLNQMAGAR